MTYLIASGGDAVVIDPCLDYDAATRHIGRGALEPVIASIRSQKLKLHWILETHIHADHLSGADVLRDEFQGARVAISGKITIVAETLAPLLGRESARNGPCNSRAMAKHFDRLLDDGDAIEGGRIRLKAMATPGHTPACMSYVCDAEGAVFTGDSLFMPELGTGRCDFPGGSATHLYNSIQRLYELPPHTTVYVGHTYPPDGQEPKFQTTIEAERASNTHVNAAVTLEDFIRFREARDKTLALPKLFEPSLKWNLFGALK